MYNEEDYLMLSGLQHFAFCRRQWALIHIEQQWSENERTAEGRIFHKKAHSSESVEKRGNLIIYRGLRVKSAVLGLSGTCDVVEFRKSEDGISLAKYEGLWKPYPVEYKKGKPKENNEDEIQLCAEAMCLEEMLACKIEQGDLFYGETHRRVTVPFDAPLRLLVTQYAQEMHAYFDRGFTPSVKMRKSCNACSLNELCVPRMQKSGKVSDYIDLALEIKE